MYTSYIGKKFLKYYNTKESKTYSPKDFFDEIIFPLFFDHPIFLMWVHNSPFDQLNKESSKKLKERKRKKEKGDYIPLLERPEERKKKKEEFYKKISSKEISGSTAVGYAVLDHQGNTSGQITNIQRTINEDEVFSSWIGQALALGLKGAYILVDKEEILYKIFVGWPHYRTFIENTPNVKGNQIETWNAHWLEYSLLTNEQETKDLIPLIPPYEKKKDSRTTFAILTLTWSSLILILSKAFPKEILNCYTYSLGRVNDTYGFINMYLPKVHRLYEIRDQFFIDKKTSILSDKDIIKLEPLYEITEACKQGTLGLKALEPKGLRKYLPKGSYPSSKREDLKKLTEKSYTTYLIYKLWVTAMLNKTELLELAGELASSLIDNESKVKRGKANKNRKSIEILDSKNLKIFIENLTNQLKENPSNASLYKNLVNEILLMPVDNFPLFIALIKFEYQYQKSIGE